MIVSFHPIVSPHSLIPSFGCLDKASRSQLLFAVMLSTWYLQCAFECSVYHQCKRVNLSHINIIVIGAMRHRQQSSPSEHALYNQRLREFLETFKVSPCFLHYQHPPETCLGYHSKDDRRRNPYRQHVLAYYPSSPCNCQQENCEKTHNLFEEYYHPLKYKTVNCNTNCPLGMICCAVHQNEYALLQKSQFFRFDLNTFKIEACPQGQMGSHELSSCRYYHGQGDRRRNPTKVSYSHVSCMKSSCNDALCGRTHNKIEQLYHPSRYKTKYCQNYFKNKKCTYHEFCSFAHSDQQIEIELLHLQSKNQEFLDYKYKTVWCPYTENHDRAGCPYAHNFQDFRRNPKMFHYTPEICTYWLKGKIESIEEAGCPLRLNCTKSHGWLQKKFHPELRKWQLGQNDVETDATDRAELGEKDTVKKRFCSFEDLGIGAPFFKSDEKQEHIRSGSTEPRTRKDSKHKSEQQVILSLFGLEQLLWKPEEVKDSSVRHRSQPKKKNRKQKLVEADYSTSLKQLLLKVGLEEKIKPQRLTQVKLVGLCEDQITKLDYLSAEERSKLASVLREYIIAHDLQTIQYSSSMIKFFQFKACGSILAKMRGKKVNQRKLLDMTPRAILDLSFLQQQEKESLPVIIDNYVDDRAFRQLNTLIKNQTLASDVPLQPEPPTS